MKTLEGRNIKLVNNTDLDDKYLKDLLYPEWQRSIEYDSPNTAILNILSVKPKLDKSTLNK